MSCSTAVLTDPDIGAHGSRRTPREAAARRTLRPQIALLESELAEAFVTAFEMRIGAPAIGGRRLRRASAARPRRARAGP